MAGMFEELPALLRFLRVGAKETLAEIEKATGISLRSIQAYETGEVVPPLPRLSKILEHYGISNFLELQEAVDRWKGRPRSSSRADEAAAEQIEKRDRMIDSLLRDLKRYEDLHGRMK